MSRIEFDSKGVPIPSQALPPPGSTDLPQTVLTFAEDTELSMTEYIETGYTHFEALCIGGSGGRGGDGSNQVVMLKESSTQAVPQNVWDLRREQGTYEDWEEQNFGYNREPDRWRPPLLNRNYVAAVAPAPGQPRWNTDSTLYLLPPNGDFYRYLELIGDHGFRFRADASPLVEPWITYGEIGRTYLQLFDMKYTSPYMMNFTTWLEAILWPMIQGMGGGGGGGGFHRAFGALDELPDTVSIVVGKAGADAGYAQTKQLGSWTPPMEIFFYDPNAESHPYMKRKREIQNYFTNYTNSYPDPTTFPNNPVKGQDGGASSFGDFAQASGGKGGEPGMVWDGTKFIFKGDGGAGGIGGQLTAGGGAAGSTVEGVNGSDGTWFPETGIGQGGGGGKGGRATTGGSGPPFYTPSTKHPGSAGGQGSYSFGDPTVYGHRQIQQPWTYMKPVIGPPGTGYTTVLTMDADNQVIAGGGGGARPFPNIKVGSRAQDYSPDGMVLLRLVKLIS
jgi:hypothetical protein